tara:strand:- start:68 stop:226 length:159 start_codon:yes stop_codon:yes gene_type:complete
MTQEQLEKLRVAYIKVYGDRWREMFAKHYWFVYDGETGQCKIIKYERYSTSE